MSGGSPVVVVVGAARSRTRWVPPTVNLVAQEPIVINLNIQHEVRVKIDREVDTLLEQEQAQEQVGSRGLGQEIPGAGDARLVATARSDGRIGERADGYLGVVVGRESKEAKALVMRVNSTRLVDYEALAVESDGPLSAVESIAGARRVAEAEPGEFVLMADGRWSQK